MALLSDHSKGSPALSGVATVMEEKSAWVEITQLPGLEKWERSKDRADGTALRTVKRLPEGGYLVGGKEHLG